MSRKPEWQCAKREQCCVPNCQGGQPLHGFPNPETDGERFRLWLYNIGGEILALDNLYIYKNRKVCRKHFEVKYLCRASRLSNIAVPTLHLPEPLFSSQLKGKMDSELLNFYSKMAESKAKCLKCQAILPQDSVILYEHLKTTHSIIPENIKEKDICEKYEDVAYLDLNDELAHDTINTENTENKEIKINAEFQEKLINIEYDKNKLSEFFTRQEKLYHEIFNKTTKNEVDAFAKYIAGLLKHVPRNKCNRLQTDIINLIMNEMEVNETLDLDMEVNENVEIKDPLGEGIEVCPKKLEVTTNSTKVYKARKPETPKQKRRRYSFKEEFRDTEDEEILEEFGRYITCMLQTIPHKHIRTKLQTKIVNLIMTARENSQNRILTFDGTIEYGVLESR